MERGATDVRRTVRATHVVRRERQGSSSPVVVESNDGLWFTKLRGAAQGVPTLIAELVDLPPARPA